MRKTALGFVFTMVASLSCAVEVDPAAVVELQRKLDAQSAPPAVQTPKQVAAKKRRVEKETYGALGLEAPTATPPANKAATPQGAATNEGATKIAIDAAATKPLGGRVAKATPTPAVITFGDIRVMGGLEVADIAGVVARNNMSLRRCYERRTGAAQQSAASVTGSFIIGPSGKLQSTKLKDVAGLEPRAQQCVIRGLKRMRFPKVKGGGIAVVTLPMTFKSAAEAR